MSSNLHNLIGRTVLPYTRSTQAHIDLPTRLVFIPGFGLSGQCMLMLLDTTEGKDLQNIMVNINIVRYVFILIVTKQSNDTLKCMRSHNLKSWDKFMMPIKSSFSNNITSLWLALTNLVRLNRSGTSLSFIHNSCQIFHT